MVNFLKIFEKFFLHRPSGVLELRQRVRPDGAAPFSAPAERGTRTAAGGFAPNGRLLSLHRLSGARELRQRVRPDRAAPFLHRLTGAHELPQACSPFPGGEFSAELQRGIRRLRTAGTCRAPRRGRRRTHGGGQKGRTTCGFPSSLDSYLSLVGIAWVQTVDCVSRKRTRQSGYLSVSFSAFSQFTDSVLLHMRVTQRRARHTRAAQILGTL